MHDIVLDKIDYAYSSVVGIIVFANHHALQKHLCTRFLELRQLCAPQSGSKFGLGIQVGDRGRGCE